MENKIKLYNDKCENILPILPSQSIDAVICDIPYGTTACPWDEVIEFNFMWTQLCRIIKPVGAIVLFGQEPFSSKLRLSNITNYKYDWYWQKERLTNVFQVKKRPGKVIENIMVFYKNNANYFPQMSSYTGPLRSNKVKDGKLSKLVSDTPTIPKEYKDNGKRYPLQLLNFKRDILTSNLHPTQKPVALMEYLVKTYTLEGQTVLDFAMGSGSTGIACINTNRNFIGIESDNDYFAIGKQRMENRQKDRTVEGVENGNKGK